jgi:hypothetical protein
MKEYSNGKIYKIGSKDTDKIYIGSTTGSLDYRMYRHHQDYVLYQNNLGSKIYSFELFDEVGFENCYIELICEFPCENAHELACEEGRHQMLNLYKIVNKNIAGRTVKQYYEDKRESILNQKREYYKNNSETRKAYQNNYNRLKKELKDNKI